MDTGIYHIPDLKNATVVEKGFHVKNAQIKRLVIFHCLFNYTDTYLNTDNNLIQNVYSVTCPTKRTVREGEGIAKGGKEHARNK